MVLYATRRIGALLGSLCLKQSGIALEQALGMSVLFGFMLIVASLMGFVLVSGR